jgi:hypothetical protein
MDNREKLIYCAGFMDGEGHIRICQHSKRVRYMLQISAVQATPQPLDFFVDLFGGTVSKRFTIYRGKPKAMFTWQCSSKAAEEALEMMLPYLVVKKDEALLALEFRKTFRPQFGERSKNSQEIEDRRGTMKIQLEQMRRDKREIHLVGAAA